MDYIKILEKQIELLEKFQSEAGTLNSSFISINIAVSEEIRQLIRLLKEINEPERKIPRTATVAD